ncbi:glycosyltransferase [Aurantiacibacter hainanensis]|uniref:glycosyltransferase n=1 Tax=Aurantiacibacter hainanensis TaxID=3076114 RepID=UPI0030C72663
MTREPLILHVAGTSSGGAAIGARRLVAAQRRAGMDAQLLVLFDKQHEDDVCRVGTSTGRMRARLARFMARHLASRFAYDAPETMRSFGLVPTGIGRAVAGRRPDIVQWHWMGAETASLAELLVPDVPSVWTCRDHWIACGAEHFPATDDFASGYADRPRHDPDRLVFLRKRRLLNDWPAHLVCLSRWSAEQVARSPLTRDRPVTVIPNTIDFDAFPLLDRRAARLELGIAPDAHVIAFGAQGGTSDPRKGFAILREALAQLDDSLRQRTVLLTFGGTGSGQDGIAGMTRVEAGRQDDPRKLAGVYAAADVFANPSVAETFGNTTLEALACGTRCVAFDTGAASELIDAPLIGDVVPIADAQAFSSALARQTEASAEAKEREMRRSRVRAGFNEARVVEAYRRLYAQLSEKGLADVG